MRYAFDKLKLKGYIATDTPVLPLPLVLPWS